MPPQLGGQVNSATAKQIDPREQRMPAQSTQPANSLPQQQAGKQLASSADLDQLQASVNALSEHIMQKSLSMLSSMEMLPAEDYDPEYSALAIFRVDRIVYDKEEDVYEKLTSLYASVYNYGCCVAMILHCDGQKTQLYFCIPALGTTANAGKMFSDNLYSQFPGSQLHPVQSAEKRTLMNSFRSGNSARTVRSVSFIPARRDDEKRKGVFFSSQGMEKFADAMKKRRYTMFFIAENIPGGDIFQAKNGFEQLFTVLSAFEKESVTFSEADSVSVAESLSNAVNESLTTTVSQTYGVSTNSSDSRTKTRSHGNSNSLFSMGFHRESGRSRTRTEGAGTNESKAESNAKTSGSTTTDGQTDTKGTTTTQSSTLTRTNKGVQSALKLLEEQIARMQEGGVFGLWRCSCYLLADDDQVAVCGASTIASVLMGDSTAHSNIYNNVWYAEKADAMMEYLRHLLHPRFRDPTFPLDIFVTPGVSVSGKELPVLLALPRKSLSGVEVISRAEFGRNVPNVNSSPSIAKRTFTFGNVCHMGDVEDTKLTFNANLFSSHCFITGASGSGKSNTTFHLLNALNDLNIPFLVVEPVKGEYKNIFGGLKDINIFTTMQSSYQMLYINPFAFPPKVHVLEHLGRLVETVSACWPLYGPMPAMLKEAFGQAYVRLGWDLNISRQVVQNTRTFPTFEDLSEVMEEILNNSAYSNQAKSDYKGALLTRIRSLTNGFEGQIFCTGSPVSDAVLFDQTTILDLSHISSSETRALIMGVLIIKLREYRASESQADNQPTRHITVLEEAHNILKRCSQQASQDSGNIQGASVGMLCDCIAEMRSYGEGFMIIDQSPAKVDETAIRNTAVKIVMRLPEKEDYECAAHSMGLNELQTRDISRLDTGIAVVMQAGYTEAVLAKMGDKWDGRHVTTIKPATFEEIMRAKGLLTMHLYNHWHQGAITSDLNEVIRGVMGDCTRNCPGLGLGVAKELRQQTANFIFQYLAIPLHNAQAARQKLFAEYLIDLHLLSDILRVIPLSVSVRFQDGETSFVQKDACLQIDIWYSKACKAFRNYVMLPEEDKNGRIVWPKEETAVYMDIRTIVLSQLLIRLGGKEIVYDSVREYLRKKNWKE